jgi:hypothetical protein
MDKYRLKSASDGTIPRLRVRTLTRSTLKVLSILIVVVQGFKGCILFLPIKAISVLRQRKSPPGFHMWVLYNQSNTIILYLILASRQESYYRFTRRCKHSDRCDPYFSIVYMICSLLYKRKGGMICMQI